MASQEFPVGPDGKVQWMANTFEDDGGLNQSWDGYSGGGWQDWMRWDPAMAPKSPKLEGVSAGLGWNGLQKIPSGTLHPTTDVTQPTEAIPALPSSNMPMMTTGGYTFGEAKADTAAFNFGLPTPSTVPATAAGQVAAVMTDDDVWHSTEQPPPADPYALSPHNLTGTTLSPHDRTYSNTDTRSSVTSSAQQSSKGSPAHASDSSHSSPDPGPDPEPEPVQAPKQSMKKQKKRKAVSDDEGDQSKDGKPPQIKKTAHNMIEKRYRTNLNDKIAALRDSVPSLRVLSRINGSVEDEDGEDLDGLTPAHKLNKATVLSKATEYIMHLEKQNQKLTDELSSMKTRVDSMGSSNGMSGPPMHTHPVSTPDGTHIHEDPFNNVHLHGHHGSLHGSQGMIPVPENLMNIRGPVGGHHHSAPQNRYGHLQNPRSASYDQTAWVPTSGSMMSKLMVGSLAGLMIMEGYFEREQSGEKPAGRGLFALPVQFLDRFGLSASQSFNGTEISLLPIIKGFLVCAAFVYILAPLFERQPKSKKRHAYHADVRSAPSLASPIEIRRKAWLTAIQTVWVPRHNFILEVAALGLKTLKLSGRKLIGWEGYSILTGITKEQEIARVKAWDIALSAQLTGGDAEINISRLLLTLMASGTLPDTPSRLMLKAMHIRVLLWEVANSGFRAWFMFEGLSAKLARIYWNAARDEHRMLTNRTGRPESEEEVEALPDHLAALIELGSEDVFVKDVTQRAYNLAWNRPISQNAIVDMPMDSVVEDFRICSPLDALAAWWSSYVLGRTLVQYLSSPDSKTRAKLADNLALAMRTAPPSSRTYTRVLAAKAMLLSEDRSASLSAACDSLSSGDSNRSSPAVMPSSPQSLLMNSIDDGPVAADVKTTLTLAKCLWLSDLGASEETARARIVGAVNSNTVTASGLSLLSFVAAYDAVLKFSQDDALVSEMKPGLERLVSAMRVWVGREDSRKSGLLGRTRGILVEKCLVLSKMLVGIREPDLHEEDNDDLDAGYVSQSSKDSIEAIPEEEDEDEEENEQTIAKPLDTKTLVENASVIS